MQRKKFLFLVSGKMSPQVVRHYFGDLLGWLKSPVPILCCVFYIVCLLCSDEGRNLNQLDDFMECLSKFTRYNSVRPLATLSYASDLYNGSSIVSRYTKEKKQIFIMMDVLRCYLTKNDCAETSL